MIYMICSKCYRINHKDNLVCEKCSEPFIKKPFSHKIGMILTAVIILVPLSLLFINIYKGVNYFFDDTTVSEKSISAPISKTWREVYTFRGNSIRDSETLLTRKTQIFKVDSNQWRINWSTIAGEDGIDTFTLMGYDKNDKYVNINENTGGNKSGIIDAYNSGEFYLTIDTRQNYKIIIEELK